MNRSCCLISTCLSGCLLTSVHHWLCFCFSYLRLQLEASKQQYSNQPSGKCSRIREGDLINVDVTSPGATLALGLMFLQSNNQSVASRLLIPDTHYLMDYVRPDWCLLRVLARHLILWDSVQPTRAWLEQQFPAIISTNIRGVTVPDESESDLTEQEQREQAADLQDQLFEGGPQQQQQDADASSFGIGLTSRPDAKRKREESPLPSTPVSRAERIGAVSEDNGSNGNSSNGQSGRRASKKWRAGPTPTREVDSKERESKGSGKGLFAGMAGLGNDDASDDTDEIDFVGVRQVYCNILAGAALSLGIRFAGTADLQACAVLSSYLRAMQQVRVRKLAGDGGLGGPRELHRVDRATLESCVASLALSLALVMAGTGHLPSFRLLRSLRMEIDKTVRICMLCVCRVLILSVSCRVIAQLGYGQQMAAHMAIGLLFLGGGRYTIDTSPAAVAALVIALYPRFPMSPDDNRCHLQALRHLYVLAAQPRAIQALDVDTNRPCYVPLDVTVRKTSSLGLHTVRMVAPCLLPPLALIDTVAVTSPRFWPLILDKVTHFTPVFHCSLIPSLLLSSSVPFLSNLTVVCAPNYLHIAHSILSSDRATRRTCTC